MELGSARRKAINKSKIHGPRLGGGVQMQPLVVPAHGPDANQSSFDPSSLYRLPVASEPSLPRSPPVSESLNVDREGETNLLTPSNPELVSLASASYVSCQAKAIKSYVSLNVAQLSFNEGEVLDINYEEGRWWRARKADGSLGIVPSCCFEIVPQLEELPSRGATTAQPTLRATSLNRLKENIQHIIGDKSRLHTFVEQKGPTAQAWLDCMQQLVDHPKTSSHLRSSLFSVMLRLSKRSGLLPQCLSIQNVKKMGDYAVAAGGFGDVWKGLIGDSNEPVCLKIVRVYLQSDMDRLSKEYLREAIVWRQAKHPNLLPFLGIFRLEQSNQLCLISPWMEKGNLIQFLRDTARENVQHYILVQDVATGLSYLHHKDIVHGDLKGVNILITPDGRACIGDFGLSRIHQDKMRLMLSPSSSHGPAGTARWLAPELLIATSNVTKESDIYAYACVCYEIFTGLHPFSELPQDASVVLKVMLGTRPKRPDNAPELLDFMWSIMQTCWVADPSMRPTATDILTEVGSNVQTREDAPSEWADSLYQHVLINVEHPTLPASDSESSIERLETDFQVNVIDSPTLDHPPQFPAPPITLAPVTRTLSPQTAPSEPATTIPTQHNKGARWLSRLTSTTKDNTRARKRRLFQKDCEHDFDMVRNTIDSLVLRPTSGNDWDVIGSLCNVVFSKDSNSKEALRVLKAHLDESPANAQLNAARIWGILMENRGGSPVLASARDHFIAESSSRHFLATLEDLLLSSATSSTLKDRILDVLSAIAYNKGGNFRTLWARYKPWYKPESGVPFDDHDDLFNPPTPGTSSLHRESSHGARTNTMSVSLPESVELDVEPQPPAYADIKDSKPNSSKPASDIQGLLDQCHFNASALKQAMAHTALDAFCPGASIIEEFVSECRSSQQLILTHLPMVKDLARQSRDNTQVDPATMTPEEQLLFRLAEANLDLLGVLGMYDNLRPKHKECPQPEPDTTADTEYELDSSTPLASVRPLPVVPPSHHPHIHQELRTPPHSPFIDRSRSAFSSSSQSLVSLETENLVNLITTHMGTESQATDSSDDEFPDFTTAPGTPEQSGPWMGRDANVSSYSLPPSIWTGTQYDRSATDDIVCRAKARRSYSASPTDSDELSFSEGEILDILDQEGTWWQATKADGSFGVVPCSYLEILSVPAGAGGS